jgi:hypothetical protein
MPTKKAVKVTTGLTIRGMEQYPPEFRSKAGRLIAKGIPVVEGVAPAGISLTPPLLCFLESDIAKRNMVSLGPSVQVESKLESIAPSIVRTFPSWYAERIEKYRTKGDAPVEIEEKKRQAFLGPDHPRWYVSSVDVYMNGEPVVITDKAKPTRKRSTSKA